MKMIISREIMAVLYLFDIMQYASSSLLYRLGLHPSFEREEVPWESHRDLLLFIFSLPKFKSLLPSLEYLSFLKKKSLDPVAVESHTCAICLHLMEPRDPVRELPNCAHAFHARCLDRWLDLSRLTCPLCRSDLYSAEPSTLGPFSILKLLLARMIHLRDSRRLI